MQGEDVFELDWNETTQQVVLRGNTGVSLSSALNWHVAARC